MDWQERLAEAQRVVVLTGAGVSAASGVPTFRGEGGYWRAGSRVYRPQELATRAAFDAMPEVVWPWYLWRRGVCRRSEPNATHRYLADAATRRGAGLTLVTQNVDGLHLRAGSPPERTWEIHGNLDFLRCAAECTAARYPLHDDAVLPSQDARLTPAIARRLRCPRCGGPGRPHVLWFDESYDEARYRWSSSVAAAEGCDALVVVGTSGQTNLPLTMARLALQRGALLLDVNPERSPFASLAERSGGAWVQGKADVLGHRVSL